MNADIIERMKEMRDLAKQYHAMGFNIVPLGDDKRPVKTGIAPSGKPWRFHWDEWQTTRQTQEDLNRIVRFPWWKDVYGIAAVNGFAGALCLDMDSKHKDDAALPPIPRAVAERWLEEFGLPVDYPWLVASPGGGWHAWMRTDDIALEKGKLDRLFPDEPTVAHIELRWFGHYTALPGSLHPLGGTYAFAN